MDSIDDLIKETLEHQADQVGGASIATDVTRRIRHRNLLGVAGSATVLAVMATAGIWGAGHLMDGADVPVEPADAPLLDSGPCAGLSVIVGAPNPGPYDATDPRAPLNAQSLTPDLTTVSMARTDHLWFQASGPCRDQLVLVPQGPVLQGTASESSAGVPFIPDIPDGEVSFAIMHANTEQAVTEDVSLILPQGCDRATCEPIATLRVEITDDPDGGSRPGTQETTPPTP